MNTYLAESVEFLGLDVTVTIDEVTTPATNFQVSVVPSGERPGGFVDSILLQGQRGILIAGYPIGEWAVYTKVTDNPEIPVELAGYFTIA